MRAVVQRVRQAAVYIVEERPAGEAPEAPAATRPGGPALVGRIGRGLAILVGVHVADTPEDAASLAGRIAGLRVFDDAAGRLNRSILDVRGEVLSIPQFTLYADTRRGRRPSFVEAAPPDVAEPLYRRFNEHLAAAGVRVVAGPFRTHMVVEIHNDGPVTILLETPLRQTGMAGGRESREARRRQPGEAGRRKPRGEP